MTLIEEETNAYGNRSSLANRGLQEPRFVVSMGEGYESYENYEGYESYEDYESYEASFSEEINKNQIKNKKMCFFCHYFLNFNVK